MTVDRFDALVDLFDALHCSPQCFFAASPARECGCRCDEEYHGRAREYATEPGGSPLVHQFIHTKRDGQIERQGCIVAHPTEGFVEVEWYSWLTGYPNKRSLMRIEDLAECDLFDSAEMWRFAYERSQV